MFNKYIVSNFSKMLLFCTRTGLGVLVCAGGTPARASTGPEQVLAEVEAAAKRHLLRQADSGALVEPQFTLTVLRGSRPLAECARAVTVDAVDTRQPGRMRFAAVCAGEQGWRYEFVVKAQVSARVAVAANDIPAGKVLAEEDLALERHDISAIADSSGDTRELVGLSGRRALRAGEVLRMALLAAPTLVKRGDGVRIVAKAGPVEVSMAGEALDNGARGATVRVRNGNGNVIRARVTAAGIVEPADMPASTQSPD